MTDVCIEVDEGIQHGKDLWRDLEAHANRYRGKEVLQLSNCATVRVCVCVCELSRYMI